MERTTQVVYAIGAALLLLGLALRVVPAPAGAPAESGPRSVSRETPPRVTPAVAPGQAAAIIEGNIFSPTRAAPRVRFTPPDLIPAETPRVSRARPAAPRLRLFGTVVGPSGTAALIDADPAVRGAEIYQVGDVVDGKRVVAVSESTVVLAGESGGGRTVLRLQPTPPPAR